ncbi:MAG: DegT/DnrJ/EryC1/StrS family aminotransferase [bacterium]|nr:DegT/DnrJ/EryC1/StrS family aminotransferase [bacterium]
MYVSVSPSLSLRDLSTLARGQMSSYNNGILYNSGRAALCAALRLAAVEKGSIVAIPSYICDVVPDSLRKAGYAIAYYDVQRDLRVSVAELLRTVSQRVRALVVVHYFGFPQENIGEIAEFARCRGIFLIEDCAHALLASHNGIPLGQFGDAAIFSLWKILPVPDGGLLVMKERSPGEKAWDHAPGSSGIPGILRLLISRFAEKVALSPDRATRLWGRLSGRGQNRADFEESVRGLAQDVPVGPSFATRLLLARLDPARVSRRRRRNYRIFVSSLDELKGAALRRVMPEGACPWAIPLFLDRRDLIRDALARHGIEAPSWPRLPKEVKKDEGSTAVLLARKILLLPVHQNVSASNMSKMAAMLKGVAGQLGVWRPGGSTQ